MVPRSRAARATAAAQPTSRSPRRPTVEGLGDEVGAAELSRRVAESLRRFRAERRMSLDQLALSSGVSRAALSQIEGARTNPTLGLMWKVAVGLGIPFQALLGTSDGSQSRVLRSGDAIPLRSTDGRMESRLLSPAGSADRMEILRAPVPGQGVPPERTARGRGDGDRHSADGGAARCRRGRDARPRRGRHALLSRQRPAFLRESELPRDPLCRHHRLRSRLRGFV